jgi:hypothetical protein
MNEQQQVADLKINTANLKLYAFINQTDLISYVISMSSFVFL